MSLRSNYFVNYFFLYFILTLVFGVYFYEVLAFDPLDEIFQVLLICIFFVYSFEQQRLNFGKWGFIWLGTFLFYFIYSLAIKSNTLSAILLDLVLQSKPFIGFFCIYYSNQTLTDENKKVLQRIVLTLFLFTIGLLIFGLFMGSYGWSFYTFFQHPSRYGTAIIILSLFYLYTTKFSRKDKFVFIIMLSFGLLSGKGKFFGFYALTVALLYLYNKSFYVKLSMRNLLIGAITITLVGIAAKEKILFYSQGFFIDKEEISHSLARPVLYVTSVEIVKDYFPFGSGFGSFATHASRMPYSSIYAEYDIDRVWGLSRDYPSFIADTHFPSLAQFGLVGVVLFISFWIAIIRKTNFYRKKFPDNNNYFFILLIVGFLAIELVADATFTYNRGFILMIFMGYLFNDYKKIEKGEQK